MPPAHQEQKTDLEVEEIHHLLELVEMFAADNPQAAKIVNVE